MTKISISYLREMKQAREKICCLTAYDASFAAMLDQMGMEVILVGDSLGMVLHGESDTLKVTMDDMVYHTRISSRGIANALLVSDMPCKSYDTAEQALQNAKRLVEEGNADMVKLEGGDEIVEVSTPFVASAAKGMAEQRIPNMRGIMAARTKPLTVVEPFACEDLTSFVSYSLPNVKSECKYIDADNMDELVSLLHNEAKVI